MTDDREQLAAWIAANPEQYATLKAHVLADAKRDTMPAKGSLLRGYLDTLICEAIRKVNGWPSGRVNLPSEPVRHTPAKAAVPPKPAPPEREDRKRIASGEHE